MTIITKETWAMSRKMWIAGLLVVAACQPVPPADETSDESEAPGEVTEATIEVQELDAPAAASGFLFKRLLSDETGVSHQNFLPKERQIEYLTMGAGVAAGDYDGDGLPDIYLVSEGGPNKLFHNLGDWEFRDVTADAGVDVPRMVQAGRWNERFNTGAAFVDTDDDGDLDLYVTALAGAATLFENQGDGTFVDITDEAGVGHVGASTSVAAGDYDRDGDVDIYVATHRPYQDTKYFPRGSAPEPEPELDYDKSPSGALLAEPDRLYRNLGDGTFEDVAEAAGVLRRDYGLGTKFSDLNGDLWPDLYVANDFETPDRLYINNADGTFTEEDPAALRHSPMFSMGMDIGDLNGDGMMDIVTSDMLSPSRVRRQVQSVDAMQGDEHHMDLPDEGPNQLMRNSLHVNRGDGTFSDVAAFAGTTASDWTWTMKIADLDLDGRDDILVTNGFVHDEMNADDHLLMSKMEQAGRSDEVTQYMMARPPLLTPNIIWRNTGDMQFEDVARAWGFDDDSITHGVALADLDGDGDLDAVANNLNQPVGLYRNDTAANRIKVALRGEASNSHGLGARLTLQTAEGKQVKEMSSSGGYLSGHEPVVVFGLGELTGADELTIEWPSGHVTQIDDLAANTAITVTEPGGPASLGPTPEPAEPQFSDVALDAGVDYVHTESDFDDFGVQPLLPEKLSQYGPGVSWGDADADGDDDLYIAGGLGEAGGLFINTGNGGFTSAEVESAPPGYEQQAALWWPTVDGAVPLASLSSLETQDEGPWPAVQAPAGGLDVDSAELAATAGALAAADYDGDGNLDLFVGGRAVPGRWPLGTPSGMYRGTGTGLSAVSEPALEEVGPVTGALWSDVDGDGDPDLLAATDMGPVKLLRNEGGRLVDDTAAAGLSQLTGRWTGVSAGDVDHDGDQDLVVANMGLNTPYRASAEEPYTVFAGDPDGDDDVDVIETEWEAGRLYPMRRAVELGRQIPYFGPRFQTFLSFARADVETVFGADEIAGMERFEVTNLEHTVLVNDGSGAFAPQSLPVEAQMQTGYGVVVEDLDNDGHLDVYLVGNFHGPEPMHIGPYDGGVSVWLRGDGQGGFESVPVSESGLSVIEDAKGLAATDFDLDGWVDLAVGVNDGRVKLMRNAGLDGRSGLLVRLIGPAGNPTGVGATVEVTRPDGLTLVREVRAGGSFWSGSGTAHVFGMGAETGTADVLVRWPDGVEQAAAGAPGSVVEVVYGSGGA